LRKIKGRENSQREKAITMWGPLEMKIEKKNMLVMSAGVGMDIFMW